MRIKFDYIDINGKRTTRTVRDIYVENEAQINAFCELRKAERSFVIDKIIDPYDLENNAPIDDMYRFLDMLDENGNVKEVPPPVEIDCPRCGEISEVMYYWALKNDVYVCKCGQKFALDKEPKK
jgi:predicted DNA-binding transcriptional regulator YafY